MQGDDGLRRRRGRQDQGGGGDAPPGGEGSYRAVYDTDGGAGNRGAVRDRGGEERDGKAAGGGMWIGGTRGDQREEHGGTPQRRKAETGRGWV